MGYPIKLMGGMAYKLGDSSNLNISAEWWDRYVVKAGATHKLDKNWTIGINQRFDSSKIGGDANPYDFGFSLSYKL